MKNSKKVILKKVIRYFPPKRKNYEDCINAGGPWTYPNSGGYGKTICGVCRVYCIGTGIWDCPRPYYDLKKELEKDGLL